MVSVEVLVGKSQTKVSLFQHCDSNSGPLTTPKMTAVVSSFGGSQFFSPRDGVFHKFFMTFKLPAAKSGWVEVIVPNQGIHLRLEGLP